MSQEMVWHAMATWLDNSKSRLHSSGNSFLNYIRDGVCILDTNNRIVYWNLAAEAVTGYRSDEVVGETFFDRAFHVTEPVTSNSDVSPLWFSQLHAREHVSRTIVRHKSGRHVPVRWNGSPIAEEDGRVAGTFILFWDATTEMELAETQAQESQVSKFLQHYVSRETYELASMHARGEVCPDAAQSEMTVMFIDIARFTAFSEYAKPDEVRELLNEFFAVCEGAVVRNRGDIDKFIGDCVMAVFLTANDAIGAGRELLEEFRARNRATEAKNGFDIRVRIGVHTGPVVQGAIGGPGRKDCTVVGDAVNTAARLERLADVDSMLISHATYQGLSDRSDFVFVGTTLIRGKSESLRLYVC